MEISRGGTSMGEGRGNTVHPVQTPVRPRLSVGGGLILSTPQTNPRQKQSSSVMPRQASGPRRIDSSGTYYAVRVVQGKRHTISLKTKIKSIAHTRWPAAQAELIRLSEGWKPAEGQLLPITYYDPLTGSSERTCLLYTSPSPRDMRRSRMPSSA